MNAFRDELEDLRKNREKALSQLYHTCCPSFIRWAIGKFKLSEHELIDLFHDAIIIMLKNLDSGRLNQLVASLCTYLFGIGKNLILAFLRKRKKVLYMDEPLLSGNQDSDPGPENDIIRGEELDGLWKVLDDLGEPCRTLLILTYEKGMTSKEIAEAMGYADADVVRQTRKRCLDKIRKKFNPQ